MLSALQCLAAVDVNAAEHGEHRRLDWSSRNQSSRGSQKCGISELRQTDSSPMHHLRLLLNSSSSRVFITSLDTATSRCTCLQAQIIQPQRLASISSSRPSSCFQTRGSPSTRSRPDAFIFNTHWLNFSNSTPGERVIRLSLNRS